jgi:hypothetical protein
MTIWWRPHTTSRDNFSSFLAHFTSCLDWSMQENTCEQLFFFSLHNYLPFVFRWPPTCRMEHDFLPLPFFLLSISFSQVSTHQGVDFKLSTQVTCWISFPSVPLFPWSLWSRIPHPTRRDDLHQWTFNRPATLPHWTSSFMKYFAFWSLLTSSGISGSG